MLWATVTPPLSRGVLTGRAEGSREPAGPAAESKKRPASAPAAAGPAPKARREWSVDEVAAWLHSLALGHVTERFRENAVDGAFLSELALDELVTELGLTRLQAKKVLSRWQSEPAA